MSCAMGRMIHWLNQKIKDWGHLMCHRIDMDATLCRFCPQELGVARRSLRQAGNTALCAEAWMMACGSAQRDSELLPTGLNWAFTCPQLACRPCGRLLPLPLARVRREHRCWTNADAV
jgi:hypothetical protein